MAEQLNKNNYDAYEKKKKKTCEMVFTNSKIVS